MMAIECSSYLRISIKMFFITVSIFFVFFFFLFSLSDIIVFVVVKFFGHRFTLDLHLHGFTLDVIGV